MLTVRAFAPLFAALLLPCAAAQARGEEELAGGMRHPQRITVGIADHYLGQLSPDGRTLYFISNRNTTNEIFQEDVEDGRIRLLFDEGADVTWPRVSPDGRWLLYISFRERADGQLCVRDLPGARERRCFEDDSAALQAEWIDRERIALVRRPSIPSDLGVAEVTLGGTLRGRPLLPQHNLTSPAISPDGRWLVYVPVERYAQRVGPAFAAHAGSHLEAVRLDHPGPPVPLQLDLPGLTGQPAFARDGRYLYVAQFPSDSNGDGVIDANDHGVLFRVRFPSERDDAPARAAAAMPEQLTEASRNCQYPAPGAERLVFTCARGQYLDVYELPLDGQVPSDWTAERLTMEIELATQQVDELLLYRRLLAQAPSPALRASVMARLVRLHLELDEFSAAGFYARQLASLPDRATAELSEPFVLLVEQRQALRDRERGRTVDTFLESARRRMDRLRPQAGEGPAGTALRHLVRGEIADSLGDKGTAIAELSAALVDDSTPGAVVEAYYERADALYRETDDRGALVAVGRRLAADRALEASERLRYARAAVRAMCRGLPVPEAEAILARERAAVPPDSELGFAVELGSDLLAIHERNPPPAAADALVALYRAQRRPDRQRALILDAVRRASDFDADGVIEALAQEYVRDARPGTRERRRAERLYLRTMVGRAYRRIAEGRLAEAQADFDSATRLTGSLESLVSSLELRLRAGETPSALLDEYRRAADLPKPMVQFAKAYLLARKLPQLGDEDHARTVAEAIAELRASWADLKQNDAAQALYGAIWQEDYLRTGALDAAERANSHFLVALELVGAEPRFRAMLLGQLGLLHTHVGNYRIALRYLEEREKLPFAENAAGLAVRLCRARALLHVDREGAAARAADEALEMVGASPRLERFRPLALDRAALYNLAAGRFRRALDLYDAEVSLLDSGAGPVSPRNRLVARLGRAAAALGAGLPGRALEDLDLVDKGLNDPSLTADLRWPHSEPEQVLRTYRLLAAGLRANACLELGEFEAAGQALQVRRALFLERLADSDRDEHLREVALVEARLADNAAARNDLRDAGRWVGLALDHADKLVDRTHGNVDPDQLAVVKLAAELGARAHAPLSFDLSRRLHQTNEGLAARGDPAWRSYQRWFEIYLTLLSPGARR